MFPWPLTMWFKADNGFKNILNTYKQVKTLKVLVQKASGVYQYTNIKAYDMLKVFNKHDPILNIRIILCKKIVKF